MLAIYLWAIGSLNIAVMGMLHLRITLSGYKLYPKNKKLVEQMKVSPLVLTNDSDMWKAWIGFNATHSSGALFIGIANVYLAVRYAELLQTDPFIPLLTLSASGFYVWVAKTYWFRLVLILLSISLACFGTSFALVWLERCIE